MIPRFLDERLPDRFWDKCQSVPDRGLTHTEALTMLDEIERRWREGG